MDRKRLKSLDEFEPLPWHQQPKRLLWPFVVTGLLIGASIGWVILL